MRLWARLHLLFSKPPHLLQTVTPAIEGSCVLSVLVLKFDLVFLQLRPRHLRLLCLGRRRGKRGMGQNVFLKSAVGREAGQVPFRILPRKAVTTQNSQ